MLDATDPARLLADHLSAFPWQSLPRGSLVTLTLPVSCPPSVTLPDLDGPLMYLARPDRGTYRLGVGIAHAIHTDGEERLTRLGTELSDLRRNWHHLDPADCETAPGAFAAWAFDPDDRMRGPWQGFPNAALLVPEILVQRDTEGQCSVSFTAAAPTDPHALSDRLARRYTALLTAMAPPPAAPAAMALNRRWEMPAVAEWQRLVQRAVTALGDEGLQKLVPARRIAVEAPRRLDAGRLMASLGQLHPECQLLAFRLGGRLLAAASPERLLDLDGRTLRVDALAGTIGRSADAMEDAGLGRHMQQDPKAEQEHGLVVRSIRAALEPLAEALHCPSQPGVMRLRNLQHLHTPIEAALRPGATALDVAARLHPTPAVAGTPTTAARRWLRRHEPLARGWYSGVAGWVDAGGDGELAVVLRCALLHGRRAELYAGAGVVAGSEPAQELAETELKFGSMLEALRHA